MNTIKSSVGIDPDPAEFTGIIVSPIPCNDILRLHSVEKMNGQIQVFDVQGRLIKTYHDLNGYNFSFSTREFTDGIYLLQYKDDTQKMNRKFVVHH